MPIPVSASARASSPASVLNETPLSMAQAAARIPGVRGAAHAWRRTVLRWIVKGVRVAGSTERLRLEGVLVGRTWWTSVEALDRFIAATTAAATGEQPKTRTPFQRDQAWKKANQALIDMGC